MCIIRSSCTLYYDLFHKGLLNYCLLTYFLSFLLKGDKLFQGSCSHNRGHNNSLFSKNAPNDASPGSVPTPPNPLPWDSSDLYCGNVRLCLSVWMLNSHPSWIYHLVLADFLRYAWKVQRSAVCAASNGKSSVSAVHSNSYKLPRWSLHSIERYYRPIASLRSLRALSRPL